ncbi:HNH/endonuclease VII fold toxin-2 domain-containing protein [Massilia aquatica]|uniref:Tox-GHH2 domain-containing protein n=1 Tax=Massilia aquatica TaxID=2609000 RepID=A0ABX0M766_9BURK|nr:HNH/endonuclease VII fold toxin-2 domain-containing protein [Massilia aquatica]NHZ40893.1 hypothetical protein [Massilia aquatica]
MPALNVSGKGSANTGPSLFFSNDTTPALCKNETENVNKECGEKSDLSEKKAKSATLNNSKIKKDNTSAIKAKLPDLEIKIKEAYGYQSQENKNSWIASHCHGLWLKPMNSPDSNFTQFTTLIGDVKADLEKKIGKKKATAAQTAQLKELDRLLSNGKNKITRSTVLAEMMTAAANANPCIQARRCILLPYKDTEGTTTPNEEAKTNTKKPKNTSISSGKAQADSGKGCCPGQTGHHVLPGAMFEKKGKAQGCEKPYQHTQAPVICVEGTGNRVGSHGLAHKSLDRIIKSFKKKGAKTISYEKALKRGVLAARRLNKNCSKQCLEAQLNSYYEDKLECQGKQLVAHSGMGGKKNQDQPEPPPAPIAT